MWEVLADTHGSDHYPLLTSILPPVAETQTSCDPSHWVFSKADWELFDDLCLERITEDILEVGDPLQSFVEHKTKAANDSIPRATTIPKKSNPWFDEECREERVGAAAVINRHFQNGETTCRQLSKRLPDNSTIFAAEATAISLALNYYQHMGPVHHDVLVYSDSMSSLQAIEGEDTENPFICHIMNLLWSLSDKGTRVRFCWVPSHCGIDGNKRVDQLAKENPHPRYRPTGKCPLYRHETTGQLLHSEIGSNQVGCNCTWQRSLSCETNTGATEEVPAPNQSWRGCNHPTLNWPYQGHQIPYLVPRTTNWLSPLWPDPQPLPLVSK